MATLTVKRLRGYEFPIHPNAEQAAFFHRTHGCVRKIYNLYVEEGRNRDEAARKWHDEDPEGRKDQSYPYEWHTNAQYKKEYLFLKEVDSLALKNARTAFFQARKNYFEGKGGSPNFKSKSQYPHAFTTNNQNYKGEDETGTIHIYDKEESPNVSWLHLPKIDKYGDVPVIAHREIKGDIHQATVKFHADGSWTVSLLVEEIVEIEADEDPSASLEKLDRFFGGDLGLACFLTGTDGISYDDPASYEQLEKRLKKEQRKLGKQAARLKKQGRDLRKCKNYQKQRRKVARIQARMANKRRDFRHKLSRRLVNNHDFIALEDLNVKGMLKNHCLARGISQSAWSDFVRLVEYKAAWENKTVVKVDRFFPSTRKCSCCGEMTGPSGFSDLNIREWKCPVCGAVHDRDENSAWNVLLEAVRQLSDTKDKAVAAYWEGVLEKLCERHARGYGSESSPTAGTAGVARVEVGGDAGDLGVNTEHPDQAFLVAGGLGEPGVSGKGSIVDGGHISRAVRQQARETATSGTAIAGPSGR